MNPSLQNLLNRLRDFLAPDTECCAFCGREGGFCADCRRELRALRADSRDSAFYYDGLVRDAVHDLKFHRAPELARPMAELMEDVLPLAGDVITCVPLHPRRLSERQYNQSELIAKHLSALTGIPYLELLLRTRHTPPQSGLKNRADRLENIRDAFRLRDGAQVAGRRILLVDDVITTGATAGECRRVLLDAGAASVRAISFAKGNELKWQHPEP